MSFFKCAALIVAAIAAHPLLASTSVDIDLQEQRAYLLKNGRAVFESPISSGRYGHLTPTGNFKILDKDMNHLSSIYGKIVDRAGRTINVDADIDMRVPRGGRFVPAPMHYFMRFEGGNGMHAGFLPGYAASHGCVRMPRDRASLFYQNVEIGTPVHVYGKTPRGRPTAPERVRDFFHDLGERGREIPNYFRSQRARSWHLP
jgi:lipoprotein-anchoring transpeptidase ErfK/SrfK